MAYVSLYNISGMKIMMYFVEIYIQTAFIDGINNSIWHSVLKKINDAQKIKHR